MRYDATQMTERVKIGELLVETGLITQDQLHEALTLQQTDPRRLGEILVATGMVSEAKVTQIVSQQLSIPWVSLEYIDFSRQILNLVSREIAEKYTLVPIYVRRARNRKQTLYVAMEDPSETRALQEIADYSGLPVRPMVAPPTDIRAAIRAYYLGLPPEEEAEPEAIAVSPIPAPPVAAPPAAPPEEIEQPVRPRDSSVPAPRKDAEETVEMVTLTLLDGTQVRLPKRGKKTGEVHGRLTARDLVEALRAHSKGSDVSTVLGEDVDWQRMFAALLSLLLKKHLIHDWEFVRELRN